MRSNRLPSYPPSAARPRLTGAVAVVLGSGLVVGLIEEGSKLSVLAFGTRRNRNLNEPVDGMVYASAVALGFAAIETLTYILRTYDIGLAYHLSPSSAAHLALTSRPLTLRTPLTRHGRSVFTHSEIGTAGLLDSLSPYFVAAGICAALKLTTSPSE